MSTQWMQIALVGTILTVGGPVLAVAQSSQAKSDTHTWNGELVLDTTAKTMTVKSRVAYQEAISELHKSPVLSVAEPTIVSHESAWRCVWSVLQQRRLRVSGASRVMGMTVDLRVRA